nr:MAG TPA: hypothetical protein [Caudoviricetes sp.]
MNMIRYIINEKKKTVTAYLKNKDYHTTMDVIAHDCFMFMRRAIGKGNWTNNTLYITDTGACAVDRFLKKNAYLGAKIVGIARCSDSDVFDKEIGKEIARKKLMEKERKIFERFRKFLYEEAVKSLNDFAAHIHYSE